MPAGGCFTARGEQGGRPHICAAHADGGIVGGGRAMSAGWGGDMTTTLKVPGGFATISAAVAAASPGDTILVAPGYPGEAVNVSVDNLVFTAPAGDSNIVLTAAAGVHGITTDGGAPIRIIGSGQDNSFTGNAGDNQIDDGSGGDDVIDGGDGNDLITSSGGTDTLKGGTGDDTFLLNGVNGGGTVDGGTGNDTVRSVDLGTYAFSNVENYDTYYGFASAAVAQLASFGNITALLGPPDTRIELSLHGAGGPLDFTTRIGGQNSVNVRDTGLASAVDFTGSVNGDILTGSSFDDTLQGGLGNDTLIGGDGNDVLDGGAGDDLLIGGSAGPGGTNQLLGGTGSDTASYAGRFETVYADLRTGAGLIAGLPTDTMSSIENLIGGSGISTLVGDDGDNVLTGGDGLDYLYGEAGDDILSGGGAPAGVANQLWGGSGTDSVTYLGTTDPVLADLEGRAGYVGGVLVDQFDSIENLTGGSGANTLIGDSGANVLTGGAGPDYLYGQSGDDLLIGGAAPSGSTNQLWGGAGNDTASFAGTAGKVYADLRPGAGYVDGLLVDRMNSIEDLVGGSSADTLAGDGGANILTGGGGADVLWGEGGADVFAYQGYGDSNLVGGYDTIGDFVSGVSSLDLTALETDAAHVLIQSDGVSTSLYVERTPGSLDPATDLAISFVGANAIQATDIKF
jgi:Ca2+-binding RTX toxin-like protein